jgi:hypothetical protein
VARFFEKLLAHKTMFGGDLWKKESTVRMIDNQEPMTPNLDGFGKNWLQKGEQRNLDAHLLQLGLFHRSEARIFEGSAHSAPDDSLTQRFVRFSHADAPLQAPSQIKRNENAAPFGHYSFTRDDVWKLTVQNSFADRPAG